MTYLQPGWYLTGPSTTGKILCKVPYVAGTIILEEPGSSILRRACFEQLMRSGHVTSSNNRTAAWLWTPMYVRSHGVELLEQALAGDGADEERKKENKHWQQCTFLKN